MPKRELGVIKSDNPWSLFSNFFKHVHTTEQGGGNRPRPDLEAGPPGLTAPCRHGAVNDESVRRATVWHPKTAPQRHTLSRYGFTCGAGISGKASSQTAPFPDGLTLTVPQSRVYARS